MAWAPWPFSPLMVVWWMPPATFPCANEPPMRGKPMRHCPRLLCWSLRTPSSHFASLEQSAVGPAASSAAILPTGRGRLAGSGAKRSQHSCSDCGPFLERSASETAPAPSPSVSGLWFWDATAGYEAEIGAMLPVPGYV
ncbi:uncharacterized protein B0I36DRAFT_352066 [Microdochium trichocladiopsis]|uniref:Secreted protein n=1 Tax=Microdochium trichocladiopsis TaxID=1682393 RepID=A0A9P8Y0B9_9PEZI|nr:uncharacterized protein B0I36DRAFT_352066 [Microdochium trichocladiopsis]KAH7026166.1 hypothetical protein B0I36DRAFT_352066 [Microdochium trichocladiopsis]